MTRILNTIQRYNMSYYIYILYINIYICLNSCMIKYRIYSYIFLFDIKIFLFFEIIFYLNFV